jgi:hypothetical protein
MRISLGVLALLLIGSNLVGCSNPASPITVPVVTAAPQPGGGSSLPPGQPLGGGSKRAGDYVVWLSSTPPQPIRGINVLEALVVDANGMPITDAAVSFDSDMTTMSHGKNLVVATPTDLGKYSGKITFMMPGPWRVIVGVGRKDRPIESVRFDFSVNLR